MRTDRKENHFVTLIHNILVKLSFIKNVKRISL